MNVAVKQSADNFIVNRIAAARQVAVDKFAVVNRDGNVFIVHRQHVAFVNRHDVFDNFIVRIGYAVSICSVGIFGYLVRRAVNRVSFCAVGNFCAVFKLYGRFAAVVDNFKLIFQKIFNVSVGDRVTFISEIFAVRDCAVIDADCNGNFCITYNQARLDVYVVSDIAVCYRG